MEVAEAIEKRRALRVFDPARPIEQEKVVALVESIRLSSSCGNNQPWRVVICRDPSSIAKARLALTKGNVWGTKAPMIMVVAARAQDDCRYPDRDYFLFSSGLAIGQMLVRAVDLGLIGHPVAGFDPDVHRRELGIPAEYTVITTIMIGYPGTDDSLLSDKQKEREAHRPERKAVGDNFFEGQWGVPFKV